jgi:hypothetical protein
MEMEKGVRKCQRGKTGRGGASTYESGVVIGWWSLDRELAHTLRGFSVGFTALNEEGGATFAPT